MTTHEIFVGGAIGNLDGVPGVTVAWMRAEIAKAPRDARIVLRINSPGGDAFEGVALHSYLRSLQRDLVTHVDGLAASAASILLMAGSRVTAGPGAMLMIHRCFALCIGNANHLDATAAQLRKMDDALAELYGSRPRVSATQALRWMDQETWFTGDEALKAGLIDSVSETPGQVLVSFEQNVIARARIGHMNRYVPAAEQARLRAEYARHERAQRRKQLAALEARHQALEADLVRAARSRDARQFARLASEQEGVRKQISVASDVVVDDLRQTLARSRLERMTKRLH